MWMVDDTGAAQRATVSSRKYVMKKNLLLIAVLAVMLAGCVVVPARPLYVHVPRVVVY
jgi:hypothetical protein